MNEFLQRLRNLLHLQYVLLPTLGVLVGEKERTVVLVIVQFIQGRFGLAPTGPGLFPSFSRVWFPRRLRPTQDDSPRSYTYSTLGFHDLGLVDLYFDLFTRK